MAVASQLELIDNDSPTLVGATVRIGRGFQPGDVLAFTSQWGISGNFDAATGTLTLTGTASLAQYQAVLRSVTFVHNGDNPGNSSRFIGFQVDDGASERNLSPIATAKIEIVPINDAPVLTIAQPTLIYGDFNTPTVLDAAMTLSDVDSETMRGATVAIIGYVRGEDVLTATGTGRIHVKFNARTGVLELRGNGSTADFEQVLRSVSYTHVGATVTGTTRDISVQVEDGDRTGVEHFSNVGNITIVLAAPPELTVSGTPLTYTENGAAFTLEAGLTLSDIDDPNMAGATVSISGGFNAGDVLLFTNTAKITGSYDAGTGVLTLTGTASVVEYQAALQSIQFQSGSDALSASKTITWIVNDGSDNSSPVTTTINVTAVNDAPQLAITDTLAYTENDGPSPIAPSATLTELDSFDYDGGTLTVAFTANGSSADQLGVRSIGTGPGEIWFDGTTVSYGGIAIATLSGGANGADMVITFNSAATPAAVLALVHNITFANNSDDPSTLARTVSFTLVDGDGTANGGADTATAIATVNVSSVNDRPVVTLAGTPVAFTENGANITLESSLTLADVDNTGLVSATVSISSGLDSGDALLFVDTPQITGSYNSGTGVLALTGTATVAQYQDALRSIQFQSTSDAPSVSKTIGWVVNDGTDDSTPVITTIDVTPVNDAPVLAGSSYLTSITEEDTNNAGQQVSSLFTSSDVDSVTAASGIAIHALSSGNGTWQFSTDGGASWSDVGAVSDASALLLRSTDYVRFVPDGLNADNASIDFYAWDQSSGSEGTKADASSRGATTAFSATGGTSSIVVTAVNDAPTLMGTSAFTAITEDDTSNGGQLVSSLFTSTDVDSGAVKGIAIHALSSGNGTWQFSTDGGGSWNGVGSVSDASALLLRATDHVRFVPDGQNADSASIDFYAWDQSSGSEGTKADASSRGGTTAFSASSGTSAIAVTAINDAPALTGTSAFTTITEDQTANSGQLVSSLFTSTDVDSGAVQGIAIHASSAVNGAWEYSLDGTSWNSVGAVSDSGALLLRSSDYIRFVPDGNNGGSDSISFYAWDRSTGTAGSTADVTTRGGTTAFSTTGGTSSLTVNSVNDAPVLTGAATFGSITEDDTNNAGRLVSTLFSSTDADSGAAARGIAVMGQNPGNGKWQYSTDNGGSWTDLGSVSAASALLLRPSDYLRFVPDALNADNALIHFYAWDQSSGAFGTKVDASSTGGTTAFSTGFASSNVTVTAVNDAPTVTTSGGAAAFTEGGVGVKIDPSIALADPDNTTLSSATIQISGSYQQGQDVLAFANGAGMGNISVFSFDATSGTLTLISAGSTATVAQWQTALRAVTFDSTSTSPGPARTISFQFDDGQGLNSASNIATRNIAINEINSPPTVTTSGGSAAFVENSPAVAVDASISVGDPDTSTLAGATVRITTGFRAAEDALAYTGVGSITGSYSSSTGVLTLSGNGTLAEYQQVLRSVTYNNTSDSPNTSTRTIEFQVNDGQGVSNLSTVASRTVTVTAINDAPSITLGTIASYTENDTWTAIAPAATLTDPDSADFNGGSLTVSFSANGTPEDQLAVHHEGTAAGQIGVSGNTVSYGGTAIGTISAVSNGVNGVALAIDFTSNSANAAAVQALLHNITFYNNNNNPSALARTIQFTLTDGDGGSTSNAATLNVTSVNDAPVNSVPAGMQTVNEDATLTLSSANGNRLSVSDLDSLPGTLKVTLAATQGNLTLNGTTGLAFSTGDGTADASMTFTGNIAAINNALNGMTFTGASNYHGAASITLTSDDQGNTGTGGVLTDTDTVNITVNSVNDAPVVTAGGTLNYTENQSATAINAGLTLSDVEGDQLTGATVSITGNYAGSQDVLGFTASGGITGSYSAGTLTLSGTASVAAYQTVLQSVTYANSSDNPATAARTVTFSVTDDNASGGLNGVQSGSGTSTVNVTSVNDAPVVTVPANASLGTAMSNTFMSIGGVSVADPDIGSGTMSVTIAVTGTAGGGVQVALGNCTLVSGSNNGAGNITISGTLSDINAALGTLQYKALDNISVSTSATITVSANDGGNTGGGALTDSHSFDVGVIPQVFVIDNSAGGTNVGTQANPFKTIADFNASSADGSGDYILLKQGTGTYSESDGINLATNQKLYGDGATLTFTNTVTGAVVTFGSGLAGNTPTIQVTGASNHGVDLTSGNLVTGLNVATTLSSQVGISDSGAAVAALTISDVDVTGSGQAIRIANGGTLNVALDTVSSSGGNYGIQLGGTITGSFSATAGSLSGHSASEFYVGGGSATITYAGAIGDGSGSSATVLSTTGGSVTLSGNISDGSDNGGDIYLTNNAGNVTFSGSSKVINTGNVGGIGLQGNTGTVSFTNGGLDVDTTSGTGISTAGGTLVITGANNTVNTTTGQIVSMDGVTVGTGGVNFGTLGASGTVANDAISLNNVDGVGNTFSGGAVTIAGTSGASSDGIAITGGSSANFAFSSATIDNTGAHGINLNGANGSVTFATVDLDGMTGTGISITDATSAVNINGGTIGSSNDPAAQGVDINNGNGNITVAANISKTTAGHVVEVSGRTGGTVTFSGNLSATGGFNNGIDVSSNGAGTVNFSGGTQIISTGGSAAVNLVNNTGSFINFTGGALDIDTTTGTGFNATGGGTVTVQGSNNSVTSTSATAVNVVTTIGTSGMTFHDISAGNNTAAADPVSGIILSTTGSLGFFTVTGTGTTAGSGGTIQNTTGDAVSLTNAYNVTLNNMNFTGNGDTANDGTTAGNVAGDHTVEISGGANVLLNNVAITNPDGGGVLALNLAGTNRITNSTISGITSGSAVYVDNNNTSNTLFQLKGVTVTNDSSGDSAVWVSNTGTANVRFDVQNSTFTDLTGQAITAAAGGLSATSGTLTTSISNNTFKDAKNGTGENNVGILVNNGATHTALVSGNLFDNIAEVGDIANTSIIRTQNSGGVMNATVSGNTIQNITYTDGGRHVIGHVFEPVTYNAAYQSNIKIDGNTVTNVLYNASIPANQDNREFLFIDYRGTAGGGNVIVTNNNFNMPSPGYEQAMELRFRETNASTVNLLVSGNTGNFNLGLDSSSFGLMDVDVEAAASLNATIQNNTLTNASPATGISVNEESGNTGVVNLSISGNNVSKIGLTENAGDFNVTQANGAIGTNNNGASATVSGTLDYSQPAPLQPATPALPGAAPLLAASQGAGGAALTEGELQVVLQAAIERWSWAGMSEQQLAAMRVATVVIADLSNAELGSSDAGVIRIDADAAGWGWFVDATPLEDSEFLGDGAASGHMDLLTVLMHELGHVAGLGHEDTGAADVMDSQLSAGERKLPLELMGLALLSQADGMGF